MPALRVLQVTPYYAEAWAYGGVPRAATALARGLARRGHKVTVCTTDAAEPAARARGLAGADGVDVRVFPNVSNALAYHLQLFLPRFQLKNLLRDLCLGQLRPRHFHR